jgi:hypothetical protein
MTLPDSLHFLLDYELFSSAVTDFGHFFGFRCPLLALHRWTLDLSRIDNHGECLFPGCCQRERALYWIVL